VIDVRLLRTDPAAVRAATARRGDPGLLEQLDRAAALDDDLREITARRDALRASVNELSKEVGRLRRGGDLVAAEAKQADSRALGDEERTLGDQHDTVAAALRDVLLGFPNLIHPDAPTGCRMPTTSSCAGPSTSRPSSPSTSGCRTGSPVRRWASWTTSGRSRSAARCSP
jgi:seryl-tRNA synthetase